MGMNLIVDIGNSRIKVAIMSGGEVVEQYAFTSLQDLALDAILSKYPTVERAIVASTGIDAQCVVRMLREKGLWAMEMTPSTPVPIRNGYLTPETLGMDRLAAAVGASHIVGGDCMIVDFGTAITIDFVVDGEYRGGNISLGVRGRFRALHDYTSRLPECEATDEILEIGRTTREAIEQGVMQGITHEIEGYISTFLSKNVKLSIIFTGGDAKFFVKRIKNAIFAKCDLVFCGLNTILEYNAKVE